MVQQLLPSGSWPLHPGIGAGSLKEHLLGLLQTQAGAWGGTTKAWPGLEIHRAI